MRIQPPDLSTPEAHDVTVFVCGDVMTGRGIDQILPHPCSPQLFEPYVDSALDYVALAERANGPIRRPVDFSYLWGDAIAELDRVRPDARIANLETAITCAQEPWPGKGIHYRMHPANAPCLIAAGIDCFVLANNHVLDWGYAGLADTLDVLRRHGRSTVGAGRDTDEALAHALIDLGGGRRVLVFALGTESAGVRGEWAATDSRAGVALMTDLSSSTVALIVQRAQAVRRLGDIVVLSVHWGDNWGYRIPEAHRTFAHRLIDAGAVELIHGHSSHHPIGIEVYRGRPILYRCGDLLNDYEGIGGEERYRPDLTLMYFASFDGSGRLTRFRAKPMRIRRFRLERTTAQDDRWLAAMLTREGSALGTRAEVQPDGMLAVRWQ